MSTFNGEAIGTPSTYTDQGTETATTSTNMVNGIVYRMKATDTGLSRVVYWYSIGIDGSGVQYTGTGPLTDIVVVK